MHKKQLHIPLTMQPSVPLGLDKLAFWVVFVNFLIESFLMGVDDRSFIIPLQFIINAGYLFTFLVLHPKKFIFNKPLNVAILLILLLVILGVFSSDLMVTYNFVLKFAAPIIYFFTAFNSSRPLAALSYWIGNLWVYLAFFVGYVIYSNVTGLGYSLYRGGMLVGYLNVNSLFVPTVIVVTSLFLNGKILVKSSLKRSLNYLLTAAAAVVIILIFKRTLIFWLIAGLGIYLIQHSSWRRIVNITLFTSMLAVSVFYLFKDSFDENFLARQSRFSGDYSVFEEGRFTENVYILDYMMDYPLMIIVGTSEVFNDREYVSSISEYGGDRRAHNSFIRIIWSSGILGLTIFLAMYYLLYKRLKNTIHVIRIRFGGIGLKTDLFIFQFASALLVLRFINEFSSGLTYIAFNSWTYLLFGVILRMGMSILYSGTSFDPYSIRNDYNLGLC